MSEKNQDYWIANISLIKKLLIIWFMVSFGAGIIFVDLLDKIHVFGFPLGFWFAEQGSIYTFVGIIVYYTYKMNKLDKQFDVEE